MAKKLFGAAKKAHSKRMRRLKARRTRKNPARKARKRRTTKRAATKRKSPKRVAAGKKAARTRKRKAAARRRTRKPATRTRARRRTTKRRRTVSVTVRNPASRRKRRVRRKRRNPRPSTQRSMLRARRSVKNKYKTPLAHATKRRYRMRSNPNAKMNTLGGVIKQALPVAASLYGARFVSYKLAGKIPGFNMIPAQYQSTAMAGLLFVGAHMATKKVKVLKKWRPGIMVGTGLNLIDNVLSAFAPANVKAMFGLADYGIYDEAMSDYVEVGDYLEVGAEPIDDDITMSDYVEVGQLEEELGALEEELGLEEDLGVEEELGGDPLSRAYLGGTARGSMLRQIGRKPMVAAIPTRSFTRKIARAGTGYDKPGVLYGGIFAGGFGN